MKCSVLVLLVLFAASCKNMNSKAGSRKMPFERNAYLVLPHGGEQSVLRQKLLNLKLTKILNQKKEVQIFENDEFQLLNDRLTFSTGDQIEYDKYKAASAQIIASFEDHLEIYFVPTGIDRDVALKDIGLSPDGERLSWVFDAPSVLLKGQTYYLLGANTDEIKENDKYFYKQKLDSGKMLYQIHHFTSNQKVLLNFKIDYLEKETAVAVKGGAAGRCTREMAEAGMCEPCTYQMEVETGTLLKKDWEKEDFEMAISLNGTIYPIEKFDLKINPDKALSVSIDLKKFIPVKDVTLEILPVRTPKKIKQVTGYNFSPRCLLRDINSSIDLSPVVQMSYQMEVRGRALSF